MICYEHSAIQCAQRHLDVQQTADDYQARAKGVHVTDVRSLDAFVSFVVPSVLCVCEFRVRFFFQLVIFSSAHFNGTLTARARSKTFQTYTRKKIVIKSDKMHTKSAPSHNSWKKVTANCTHMYSGMKMNDVGVKKKLVLIVNALSSAWFRSSHILYFISWDPGLERYTQKSNNILSHFM